VRASRTEIGLYSILSDSAKQRKLPWIHFIVRYQFAVSILYDEMQSFNSIVNIRSALHE
jgi:hypothetical protein